MPEITEAHHERIRLEAALLVLMENRDFTEMWQVRDYVRYILEGDNYAEAIRRVFGSGMAERLRGGNDYVRRQST